MWLESQGRRQGATASTCILALSVILCPRLWHEIFAAQGGELLIYCHKIIDNCPKIRSKLSNKIHA